MVWCLGYLPLPRMTVTSVIHYLNCVHAVTRQSICDIAIIFLDFTTHLFSANRQLLIFHRLVAIDIVTLALVLIRGSHSRQTHANVTCRTTTLL